jgi:hypothetical protein
LPFIRRVGQCGPYGERNVVHRAEGGSAYAPLRIVEPDRCGDGHVDPGEQCDPPNGTTCSAWCGSCRSSEGPTKERTLACLDGDSAIGVAASWNRGFEGAWRGRRLLPSGAPASGVEELYSYGFAGPGMCGPTYSRGPLALATTLDESGVHSILTRGQRCGYE